MKVQEHEWLQLRDHLTNKAYLAYRLRTMKMPIEVLSDEISPEIACNHSINIYHGHYLEQDLIPDLLSLR
jgi:hypothetical protein